MVDMSNIEFDTPLFQATTYCVGNPAPDQVPLADPFLVVAGEKASLAADTADEIPFFFAQGTILGAAKITAEDAVNGTFKERFHAAITQYALDPNKIEVYMGPCLTFSHTPVDRPLIERMMDLGYRAACKRTDGVDFLDVPVLVLMQCRSLGVPMENIHIGDYDTYENPELLHSALRGDKSLNRTVAKLK